MLEYNHFFAILALWLKETPDMICGNSKEPEFNKRKNSKIYDQLACQKFCEADSGCVGIATQTTGSLCFLCLDDVVSSFSNNYGFYRRPLGNSEMHSTL